MFGFLSAFRKKNKKPVFGIDVRTKGSTFEDHCHISDYNMIKKSTVGRMTSFGRYAKIYNSDIGRFCSISWDVTIGAMTHPISRASGHAFAFKAYFGIESEDNLPVRRRTVVGNDVWIGCNVTIMEGVTVGSGAVIGAGAVVTKDVAPYSVVAGVPAKHIKWRFDEKMRSQLLESRWWDWSDEVLKENIDLFKKDLDEPTSELLLQIGEKQFSASATED